MVENVEIEAERAKEFQKRAEALYTKAREFYHSEEVAQKLLEVFSGDSRYREDPVVFGQSGSITLDRGKEYFVLSPFANNELSITNRLLQQSRAGEEKITFSKDKVTGSKTTGLDKNGSWISKHMSSIEALQAGERIIAALVRSK